MIEKDDFKTIKFFCSVMLLIFGRKSTIGSSGQLQPYNAREACSEIDYIEKRQITELKDSLS